ncbi:hypothetical protein AAC387_Pa05g0526 [Persea americana]
MNKHGYPPSVISDTALMEAYGTAGQYNQAKPTSKEEIFSRGIQIHAEKHRKHQVSNRNEKALTSKGTDEEPAHTSLFSAGVQEI